MSLDLIIALIVILLILLVFFVTYIINHKIDRPANINCQGCNIKDCPNRKE